MTDPKPSTNDILAKIRAKAAASESAVTPAETEGEAPAPAAAVQSEVESAPAAKPVAATPGSTADILAAARAKAAAKPAATPGSTADILAAAKAGAKPAVSAAKPAAKSPADIMAAIRGGGATVAAGAPAAVATAVEKTAAPKPTGLSAADMIKAARAGVATGDGKVPAKVALPAKPLAAKAAAKPASAIVERRGFLEGMIATICSPIVIAWSSFTATVLASTLATARFMMPNVLVEPPTRFKIGPPNDYGPGTVSTKWQAQFGIWVVNAEVDGAAVIYALSTVCTHLGCTPNWLEGEQKFKCPCHGSGFYKTGVNFEGPAPRPLERFGLRLAEDGMLEVDKGLKFQKELGQWSNPACFVPVA